MQNGVRFARDSLAPVMINVCHVQDLKKLTVSNVLAELPRRKKISVPAKATTLGRVAQFTLENVMDTALRDALGLLAPTVFHVH